MATTPKTLRIPLLTKLATMSRKVFGNLRQNQLRYITCFEQIFWTSTICSFGGLVYVGRTPLVSLPINSNPDKYHKLLSWVYGLFRNFQVTEHTLTVDVNSNPNTISAERETPVTRSINHLRYNNASKTFLEDKTTLRETHSYTETVDTSSMFNEFIKDAGLLAPAQNCRKTSLEDN